MRSDHVLYSLVHLFVVLFILILGLFLFFIPNAPQMTHFFTNFIENEPLLMRRVGIAILAFGCILFIGFFFLNRRRFIQIKMKPTKASIDQAIIQEYITKYWQQLFPSRQVLSDILIGPSQKLELVVHLPHMQEKEREQLLQRVENELGVLLMRKLGYEKEFYLTIADTKVASKS